MTAKQINAYNIKPITRPEAKSIIPMDFSDLKLNLREYKYVAVYCSNGFKGGEACAAAGYRGSKETLRGLSWALQKRPHVMEAIKRFIDSVIAPYKTRLEYQVLELYSKRAFYDVSIFYDSAGHIIPLDEIEEEWRQCIDGVEVRYYGKEASRKVVTYQLPNRDTALQMLWRIVTGMSVDDDSTKLPSEARLKLQKIREIAQGQGLFGETQIKTKITASVEQTTIHTGKPGRPRKQPIIDITED